MSQRHNILFQHDTYFNDIYGIEFSCGHGYLPKLSVAVGRSHVTDTVGESLVRLNSKSSGQVITGGT